MRDELDTMGPVDYLVVQFPEARVPSEVLSRLVDLVDQGVVRILDLAFVRKEADGSLIGLEVADLDGDPGTAARWNVARWKVTRRNRTAGYGAG